MASESTTSEPIRELKMLQTLSQARNYLNTWQKLAIKELYPNGVAVKLSGEKISIYELEGTIWLDYREQCALFRSRQNKKEPDKRLKLVEGFTKNDLRDAVQELVAIGARAYQAKVVGSIKKDGALSDSDEMDKLMTAFTKYDELDKAVFMHWMWQIKRKMLNMPVSYHIMPILYSDKQGVGKSYFIKKLIAPLKHVTLNWSLHLLSDSRNHMALGSFAIAFFDELQGAARTDIDILKNLITADDIAVRKFHTQQVISVPQRCSFIGATNRPLGEQIFDSTGMRRFYEFKIEGAMDWKVINDLNYLQLWRAIDEGLPRGYLAEHQGELNKKQETYTITDDVQEFLNESEIVAIPQTPENEGSIYEFKQFYEKYQDWCEDTGTKALNKQWFSRKLANRGFVLGREWVKTRGKMEVVIYLGRETLEVGQDSGQFLKDVGQVILGGH